MISVSRVLMAFFVSIPVEISVKFHIFLWIFSHERFLTHYFIENPFHSPSRDHSFDNDIEQ